MGVLILVIVVCLIIGVCCSDSETTRNNNSNLTLDVDRMYQDSVHVNIGTLSKAEYERRKKTGYYMVPKGTEYSFIDELRKKRVEKINENWNFWEKK